MKHLPDARDWKGERSFFERRAGSLIAVAVCVWLGIQVLVDYDPSLLASPAISLAYSYAGLYVPATLLYFGVAGYLHRLWARLKRRA